MPNPNSKAGHLLIVEGPENTGKTSLAQQLAEALTSNGVPADYMSFPGRDTASVGAVVYAIEHEPARLGIGAVSPSARQALHLAAHLDAIEARIKPALASGHWVVLDRYWWSMWAHGTAQGVSTTLLRALVNAEIEIWQPIQPAIVFCTLRPAPFQEATTLAWQAPL